MATVIFQCFLENKKTSGWHVTDSHPLFVWQFEEAKKQLFKYLLSSLQNEMITMAMIMIM